jgi:hypothetical protein
MIHLTSELSEGGVLMKFLQDRDVFEMQFSRVVLGLSYEEGCHAVIVGERARWFDPRSERERRDGAKGRKTLSRYYVVLDEAHHLMPEPVFKRLVEMKDAYEARTLHAPDRPLQLAESLRNLEGLSFYRETRPHIALTRWPSFRRFELKTGINPRTPPDETTVHRELEALSTIPVLEPESGLPMMGLDQEPVTAINMPSDFNNQTTFAAMRNGRLGPCQALWMAISGLEQSRPPDPDRKQPPVEPILGNNPTGY